MVSKREYCKSARRKSSRKSAGRRSGSAKKRTPRKPSAYNLFVKKYFENNPSSTLTAPQRMKKAAAEWRKMK